MSKPANTRALAAKGLYRVMQGQSLSSVLPITLKDCIDGDHAFLRDLLSGSTRFYHRLNAIAKILLNKPFEDEQKILHALLIVGLYQLEYQKTPNHAAINESVNACEALNQPHAKTVINACLRRFLREKEQILPTLDSNPVTLFSHPKWLVKKLQKSWPEKWQSILDENNQPPPFCLRINQRQTDRESYIQSLDNLGLNPKAAKFSPQGIYINPCSVDILPKFNQGWVSVQDEAAQLAASLLTPKEGENILDACAAPGGKSAHLLELADIELTALELEPKRLVRMQENLARLNLEATLITGDANQPKNWSNSGKLFDKILLDVPCSATGVIRRHPDIKLLRKVSDIEALVIQQANILDSIWALLKEGGRLLYATCSVLKQENEQQMTDFLARTPDAKEINIECSWGIKRQVGRQLFATRQKHDGFYYALVEKQKIRQG